MNDFCAYWREATELTHQKIRERVVDRRFSPEAEKTYPGSTRIALPSPATLPVGSLDVWEALRRRRSVRRFTPAPLALAQLAALLWAAQGATARQGPYLLRTAPSAGALYPLETYVFSNRVEGLPQGWLHFRPSDFSLEVVREGDDAEALARACLGQRFLAEAAATFVWTALPGRSTWKYGDRAARYVGLDIGHAAQNLLLGAVALGLGACAVGAFLDEPMNALLGLDGEEEFTFYLAAVGAAR